MRAPGCSNPARLTRCGSTWSRPARGPAISSWIERGEGPDRESGVVAARPRGVGRRHPRAQGDADQLSPLGGDRRRLAGGDGCRAGSGPVLVDQRPPAAADSCSACRLPPTCITASCATAPGESCRSRPRPPACANSAPPARRRRISAAWPACLRGRRLRRTPIARGKARFGVTLPSPAVAWWRRPGSGKSWRQNRAHGAPRGRRKAGRRKNALHALPPASRASAPPGRPGQAWSRRRSPRSRMRSARRSPEFWLSAISWQPRTSTSASGAGSIPSRRAPNISPASRHCLSMPPEAAVRRPECGRTCSICGRWRAARAIRSPAGRRRKVCNPTSIFRRNFRRWWSAIPCGCAPRWKT